MQMEDEGYDVTTKDAYNAANHQKPHDDLDGVRDALGIRANLAVDGDGQQILLRDRQVKDGADANRAEEADKRSLVEMLDLVNPPVHGKHNWQAAANQDENAEKDEPIERNDVVAKE